MNRNIFVGLLLSSLVINEAYGDASTAYIGGLGSRDIWQMDLSNGSFSILTSTGVRVTGVEGQNVSTLFFTNQNENLYKFDTITSQQSTFATILGSTALRQIAFANNNTVYVIDVPGTLYNVDLAGRSVLSVASVSGVSGSGVAVNEPITASPTMAYVTIDSSVFRVDLNNNTASLLATISGASLKNIELRDNFTAYVVDNNNDSGIYQIDLTNGNVTTVTTIPGARLQGIELASYTTAFVSGQTSQQVYRVDLTTGSVVSLNAADPISSTLVGLSLIYEFPGQSGNNQSFANHLLNQAPYYITSLLIKQPNVTDALMSTTPTRNALGTYASQITYLAMGQVIWDHLVNQNRSYRDISGNDLCCSRPEYGPSVWISGLGAYTHEKSQNQTPAFHTTIGGGVAGFEYKENLSNLHLLTIGVGAGFADTGLDENNSAGSANIQQLSLFLYSSSLFDPSRWNSAFYLDLSVAGGYYNIDNTRNIFLIGFPTLQATSSRQGWQLAPHLEIGVGKIFEHSSYDLGIQPFAAADWISCWEGGFFEEGAGILNTGAKGRIGSLLRAQGGLRFNETFYFSCGTLNLEERVNYTYQKTFGDTGKLNASLMNTPGTFVVETMTGAQNLGVGAFEILFSPTCKEYISFTYQGQFGSQYQTHEGILTVSWDI